MAASAGTAETAINVKVSGHDEKSGKRVEVALLIAGTSLLVRRHYSFGFWVVWIKALGQWVSRVRSQLRVFHRSRKPAGKESSGASMCCEVPAATVLSNAAESTLPSESNGVTSGT